MLHLVDRLLHGIAGILTFIHRCIIVGCICSYIIFNILLHIQIMHCHEDRFAAEVVSLRLVSYSKAKAATYAQGVNGATSGGRPKDVSNHKEGVAAETGYFNIN